MNLWRTQWANSMTQKDRESPMHGILCKWTYVEISTKSLIDVNDKLPPPPID